MFLRIVQLMVFVFFPFTVLGANLIADPDDFNGADWTLYGAPTVTDNGDGTQTLAQTTSDQYYAKQDFDDSSMADKNFYVFKAMAHPAGLTDDIGYLLGRYYLYDGVTYDSSEILTSRPRGVVPWSPFIFPFRAQYPANPTYINFLSGWGVNTVTTADFKEIALYEADGYTVYITGDSMCKFAVNSHDGGTTQATDAVTIFGNYFSFDNEIAHYQNCVDGAELPDILVNAQADLLNRYYPLIILEGGVNDITSLPDGDLASMQSAMSDLIALAKKHAGHVVVFNCPPVQPANSQERKDQITAYNAWLVGKCISEGVELFDFLSILSASGTGVDDPDPAYYYTGGSGAIHPRATAHQDIATALTNQLDLLGDNPNDIAIKRLDLLATISLAAPAEITSAAGERIPVLDGNKYITTTTITQ